MDWRKVLSGTVLTGAGLLIYGALVEVDRLEVVRIKLRLPGWPEHLNGFRIGLMADLHLRDRGTMDLSKRALAALIDENPDVIALLGDFVSRWTDASPSMLIDVLDPLLLMGGRVVAVPGNRDYLDGEPDLLRPIFDACNIQLLRNSSIELEGVTWIGVDSANAGEADPLAAIESAPDGPNPRICLWHEPDLVDWLPPVCSLMLSGHSHGGQFTTPWGYAPVTSRNGRKYMRGYFPHAPTPLYVSRGLGTTGPPSRLFCRPEATILTLCSA